MSEKTSEPAGNEKLEQIRAEAQSILEEIKKTQTQTAELLTKAEAVRKKADEDILFIAQAKAKIDDQLKGTEAARKKADEDASYANQAKVNTEEHSKATAVFKGTAEADLSSIATNKKNFDELVATVTVGKVAVEADIKKISENKTAVEKAAGEIVEIARKGTARLHEIDASKSSVETLLQTTTDAAKAATDALKLTTDARTSAEAAKKNVDKFSEKAETLTASIEEGHKVSLERSSEIEKLLVSAKAAEVSLAKVLEHLAKSDGIATGHEARVEELSKKLEALNARAESLLPGFTSTGLSYSFEEQKTRFASPQGKWLKTFIWCIVGLGVVALPSFVTAIIGAMFGTKPDDWGLIFRSMAMRLPIVIPLVWLAVYAGKNYMLSIRLEEDYAYKESLSKAFEGYKREMKDIPVEDITKNPSPLNTLCVNVLKAIAERPGRIYDGKHKDITPLNETLAMAQDLRKKNIAIE